MANVLVTLCRSCCSSFKHLSNFRVQRMPLMSFALLSRHSGVSSVGCLPMLQCQWTFCGQRNHFSVCSTLQRWQMFTDFNTAVGCIRKISSSKMMYSLDKRDKESGTTASSSDDVSSDSDDTISRDSAEVSGFEAESTEKAKPVSDTDVEKELLRYDYEEFELIPDEELSIVQPVKESIPVELKRGTTGVFDVEEVVDLLRDENAKDICVIVVPPELKYVNYMVIVTGRSTRHLRAMAAYIKWVYKRKRSSSDPASVKIEGESTQDWFAIDLGNVAVHLFLEKTRRMYDLETLWTVGVEHDDLSQKNVVDDVTTSTTLEDFSFDAELERLRTLRGYGDSSEQSEQTAEPSADSMESQGNWHQQ